MQSRIIELGYYIYSLIVFLTLLSFYFFNFLFAKTSKIFPILPKPTRCELFVVVLGVEAGPMPAIGFIAPFVNHFAIARYFFTMAIF